MDRFRKCYSHLVGDWFLAEKAAWVLSRYLTTESAYYCMLIDKHRINVNSGPSP